MFHVNQEHVLEGASYVPTNNATLTPEIKPKYIILHGTGMSLAEAEDLFCGGDEVTKESAHLFVESDGKVTQFAPFNVKTWHAGVSYWQGYHGLNGFSIGVYVQFPPAYSVLRDLVSELVACYNIRDVLNHADVCDRAHHCCPVDMSHFKRYTDYGNADSVGRFVTTSNLAVRGGPDVRFEIVEEIHAGDGVKVLRYSRCVEWAFVLYTRPNNSPKHGWVHESFLRRL